MTSEVSTDSPADSVPAPPAFSSDQIAKLLALIKDSDSVELKLTVPEAQQRSTVAALGMDPLTAQIRQVFFFDTPELALDKHGVVVRARRVQGKGDDSVVKLRPVVPAELPKELRKSAGFRVEVDALPGGFVCSGTLKGAIGPPGVSGALAQGDPCASCSRRSSGDSSLHTRRMAIALDDLGTLGPIFVLKLRFAPKALGRKLVAEMWLYPDGSRILELSTRCTTGEAFQVAAELRAYLADNGVEISGEQETKTRKALEYFAGARREDGHSMTPDSSGAKTRGCRATIVPRWEWRTFGADDSAFAERSPENVQESDELYLLSLRSDASVKVRDELMDVKQPRARERRRARAVAAGDEGDASHWRRRTSASCSNRSASRFRRSHAANTHSTTSSTRSSNEPGAAGSRGAQAPRALPSRRLYGGADRCADRGGGDAHDRRRVGGPGAA